MAAHKCAGCGTFLTGKYLTTCPRCGTAFNPADRYKKTQATLPASIPSASISSRSSSESIGRIIIVSVTVVAAVAIYANWSPSTNRQQAIDISSSLRVCQDAILSQAKFGDSETPPAVPNHGSGDEFYFAWPHGSFHFKNGFNASVKMSASCIGKISTGQITSLTVNGQDSF